MCIINGLYDMIAFDLGKIHVDPRKLTHYSAMGSMKGTLAYIGLPFNPSRLVFSCCLACFFFVQRFGIQYHSVFIKCYYERACDVACETRNVPHERAKSRRAYSRSIYVHTCMNQVRRETGEA